MLKSTWQSVNVTDYERNIQQLESTDSDDAQDNLTEVPFCNDGIESSTFECVPLREENDQQLQLSDFSKTENIVIEELYVDDWMSLERLNAPTDDMEEIFIDHLPEYYEESYDFRHELETQEVNTQRYCTMKCLLLLEEINSFFYQIGMYRKLMMKFMSRMNNIQKTTKQSK